MRFVPPPRSLALAPAFQRLPLAAWSAHADLLCDGDFPSIERLNARRPAQADWRFVAQTAELLDDGRHYEERIGATGDIATREGNWHDLFNAAIWLRHAALKRALNARQVEEIARMGPKRRSRAQCALTHFDEAGAIVRLRDPILLALWDAHDWHGLFWRERAAWHDGRIALTVFGHALLEHALCPAQLLCAKTVVLWDACARTAADDAPASATVPALGAPDEAALAALIRTGACLDDPQGLRPLPLSGIPGFDPRNAAESFYAEAACFRPLPPGRRYPAPLAVPA